MFGAAFRAQFLDLLRWRRDVRCFRRDAVPAQTVDALLSRAHLAPSVGLSQPWRFVLVETPSLREAVRADFVRCNAAALASQAPDRAAIYARLKLAGLDEAPVHLAVFAEPAPVQGGGLGRATMPETAAYSTVIALHTLWLAACTEGLGLGWVSILDPARIAGLLGLPPHWTFVGYLCLGYPAEPDDVPLLERAGWETRRPAPQILRR